jgi:hypothetical protein
MNHSSKAIEIEDVEARVAELERTAEASNDSPAMPTKSSVHGTTPDAAAAIARSGRFTTEGVKRQYNYSEFGPDAIYFARRVHGGSLRMTAGANITYERNAAVAGANAAICVLVVAPAGAQIGPDLDVEGYVEANRRPGQCVMLIDLSRTDGRSQ